MTTIILISILGSVISAIIGTFWYSMSTPMGKWHMEYLGFDKLSKEEQCAQMNEMKPHMWKYYSLQSLLSFLTSFFIAFVMSKSLANGESIKMFFGYIAFTWLAFTVPVIGSGILWSNCKENLRWKKFFSDSLNYLFTIIIVSLVSYFILK